MPPVWVEPVEIARKIVREAVRSLAQADTNVSNRHK